jgi:4-alpha-glucanotransferase
MIDAALAELAEAHGVLTCYQDAYDQPAEVSAGTVVAVLASLGVDASTPEAVAESLADARLDRWRRPLPPTVVGRAGQPVAFAAHAPDGATMRPRVECEDGTTRTDLLRRAVGVAPVEVDGVLTAEAVFELPADLPFGWHRIVLERPPAEPASATLIVVPERLDPPALRDNRRGWGLLVQLYAARSAASWGIGDFADLALIARWSGHDLGASYLLCSPVHAAAPVAPIEDSPYFPATRRFVSPLYLRLEQTEEYAAADPTVRREVEALGAPLRAASVAGEQIGRDAVWAAKRAALELLWTQAPRRQETLATFRGREGAALADFATWCALAEEHGRDWRDWPAQLHDPSSAAVAAEIDRRDDRVAFHAWCQLLCDEQLAAAQRAARDAGMPIGIVHDLAVGVDPGGADAWRLSDTLARGVTVGAPADEFNQRGQDWQQPPWRPDRLADAGYAPYRELVRALLRHAGGLRVDHIIGLFRLWWIPAIATEPSQGAYVRFDAEALLGVLLLEAHRAGAVVVGEDLGVVEPAARAELAERGVLGTSVLWFERDDEGAPLPAEQWRRGCLATVTTHDLPTAAGWLSGAHVELRDSLGLLARPAAEERAQWRAERAAWRDELRRTGVLAQDADGADVTSVVDALHAFLFATPCALVGIGLPDIVGDRRQRNQPGTRHEYPNWRLPLADADGRPVLVDELPTRPAARRLAGLLAREGRSVMFGS